MALVRQTAWLIFILMMLCLGGGLGLRYHDGFRDFLLLSLLKPYGVESVSTHIESFGISELRLGFLEVTYVAEGLALEARLEQLTLQRVRQDMPFTSSLGWSVAADQSQVNLVTKKNTQSAAKHPEKAFELASLLPQSLLQQVPLHAIELRRLTLDYQPRGSDQWHLDGYLELSRRSAVSRFGLDRGGQRFQGELVLNPDSVELALGDPAAGASYWIHADARLSMMDGRLVGGGQLAINDLNHTEDWLALLPVNLPETANWHGHSRLTFSFGLPESTLQAWLGGNSATRAGLVLSAQLQHDISLGIPALDINQLVAKGSASVQVEADNLQIQPWELEKLLLSLKLTDPDMKKSLKPLLGSADAVSLTGSGKLKLSGPAEHSHWNMSSEKTRFNLKVPGQSDSIVNQLTLDKLSLTVNAQQLKTAVASGKFTATLPDKPPLKGVASVTADRTGKGHLKGKADLLLEDLTRFRFGYHYQPSTRTVTFNLDSEKTNLATTTFNTWAEKLKLPFHLELGDFSMAVEGEVDLGNLQNLSFNGKMLVSDWHGNLEKNRFKSLTSPFAFSGDLNQFSVGGEVSNGLFDIGIPITDIRYKIQVEGDLPADHFKVTVTNLESRLVGGLVRIPRFAWDNKVQNTRFNVVIYNWQFAEIIELLQRNDLEVGGILDGMLPVHVSEKGWEIRDGRLTARAPGGVIRYKPEPSMKAYLSNQKQLKMAVDILENFHYETLNAVVNQELDGTQYINLTLKGKNPKAYGGTPVNLNLNIEHNINPLMQSLTLPGEIQENWDKLNTIKQ
ncbi:MAG: YdbH domain-containing protein [Ketobacteraceae bacterium]|nr:YdbH domain-containing protein [Ketobacteraceae bacterium]